MTARTGRWRPGLGVVAIAAVLAGILPQQPAWALRGSPAVRRLALAAPPAGGAAILAAEGSCRDRQTGSNAAIRCHEKPQKKPKNVRGTNERRTDRAREPAQPITPPPPPPRQTVPCFTVTTTATPSLCPEAPPGIPARLFGGGGGGGTSLPGIAREAGLDLLTRPGQIRLLPGRALTGLETYAWLEGTGARTTQRTAAGFAMRISVRPVSYHWDFGDDTFLDAGAGTPGIGRSEIRHTYQRSGRYQLRTQVTWGVTYEVNGETLPAPGTFETTSALTVPVDELRVSLTH